MKKSVPSVFFRVPIILPILLRILSILTASCFV